MSKKIKVLLAIFFVFILGTVGAFYYLASLLTPENVKEAIIAQSSKVFPLAKIELGDVGINAGFNFKINLSRFRLSQNINETEMELMSVDDFVVKIPFWAIVTNGGVIEVKMDRPRINYHEFKEGNNWTLALAKKTEVENKAEKSVVENNSKQELSSISFFKNSKINVRFNDIVFKYQRKDASKGEVIVSRFVFKGINLKTPTVYELQSHIDFNKNPTDKMSFDVLAIGQLNLKGLNDNGPITSKLNIKMNNFKKSNFEGKLPDFSTDLDFELIDGGKLQGQFVASFEGQNKISAKFFHNRETLLEDLVIDIALKDLQGMLPKSLSYVDLSKAKFQARGKIEIAEDKKINPQISFSLSPSIIVNKDGMIANTTGSGELKGESFTSKFNVETFDGLISSQVKAALNYEYLMDFDKMSPVLVSVSATGLKIPEKFIKSKMWEKKAETSEGDVSNSTQVKKINEPNMVKLPPVQINLEWSNILIAKEEFHGKGKIASAGNKLSVENFQFKFSKGNGVYSQTTLLAHKNHETKFSFEMQNLNLDSFQAFLPPFVENFSGTFNGKIMGQVTLFKSLDKKPIYDIAVALEAKKGEIKKLNIGQYISPILNSIPLVKDKMKEKSLDKELKLDGNFETLNLKGQFSHLSYKLSSFEFDGIDKKVKLQGAGDIFPISENRKSQIDVQYTDGTGKISEVLLKNTGTKVLPLRVSGPGFELKPEINYTLEKIAKGAIKTKGEEKLKEVVQKNIEKIIPENTKEKVQGLLNGLFKKK